MYDSTALRVVAVAMSLVGIACSTHRTDVAASPSSTSNACTGKSSLRITNDTRSDLEIVEIIRNSRVVVAAVGPGSQTVITAAPGATYAAREVGSENWVAWERSTRQSSLVRFRRECA